MRFLCTSLITVFILIATSALAHKVLVFAYRDGSEIHTEVKFNNGRPAKKTSITVEKNDGTVLLRGNTDDKGVYRFPPPAEAVSQSFDLTIVADLGEGHRGEWKLNAADYVLSTFHKAMNPANGSDTAPRDITDCGEIDKRVEAIIARELAPIKKILAERSQRTVSIQDILGGLGYIIGLAGCAAYISNRKSGEKK